MSNIRTKDFDEQLENIEDLIIQYASGNFDFVLSSENEEGPLGTVVTGIQMLGEELKERTVSKEYFKSIFNSVNYGLFICDHKGTIIDCNKIASHFLALGRNKILKKSIFKLLPHPNNSFTVKPVKSIQEYDFETEMEIKGARSRIIAVSTTELQEANPKSKYIIRLVDITERQQFHQQMMAAIIDTQEKERDRIANDLHDSIGQHLVALKMFLNFLDKAGNEEQRAELQKEMFKLVEDSIQEIRTISYDQMPETLRRYGLKHAITDLSKKFEKTNPIRFHLLYSFDSISLKPEFEINLFRIAQEFIQNTIKHAQAQNIRLAIIRESDNLLVNFSDDGKGFTNDKSLIKGKGLKNIESRISIFDGKYSYDSSNENGTVLKIKYTVKKIMKN